MISSSHVIIEISDQAQGLKVITVQSNGSGRFETVRERDLLQSSDRLIADCRLGIYHDEHHAVGLWTPQHLKRVPGTARRGDQIQDRTDPEVVAEAAVQEVNEVGAVTHGELVAAGGDIACLERLQRPLG